MKDDAMTPEDVKTPPPLTPKDSLSVEVEEMRTRLKMTSLNGGTNGDVRRLLSIVDELRKERDKIYDLQKGKFPESANEEWLVSLSKDAQSFIWAFWEGAASWEEDAKKAEGDLATAQAQLRRKDEALERIAKGWTIMENDELSDIARAALADGKEGGE